MESKLQEENQLISKLDFNHYKFVHLFLYTYIENKLKILLFKRKGEEKYQEIKTNVHKSDNVPPFAIARKMATELRGLFSSKNIEKISKNEKLTKEDCSEKEEYYPFEIWHSSCFTDWLDFLSEKPLIQYDNIEGKMLYFYNFPMINIKEFNKNLSEIYFPYEFIYYEYDDTKIDVDTNTINILNFINYIDFISESESNIQNDNLDYYLVLAVKPPSEKKADQAGFFHFPALFQGLYRRNDEKWLYKVCSVELPNDDDLKKIKRIIIPGSHFSVYDDHKFIKDTEVFIRNIVENHKDIKLLGICFGEQLIIQALGGKVQKMKTDFSMFPEVLNINDDFWEIDFVKKSKVEKTKTLIIPQAHGDEVIEIPKTTSTIKNFGQSNFCHNEILVSEDEKLFLVQGHPEYNPHFSLGRIVPFYLSRRQLEMNVENGLKAMEELEKNEFHDKVNSEELRKLCYSFLKN